MPFTARTTPSFSFAYPKPSAALACGRVSLEPLARQFGTPLYVYSGDQIVERLRMFQERGGRDHHALCGESQLRAGHSQAACRSGRRVRHRFRGRTERVLAAAPEAADRVVFSGVGKTEAEIDRALQAGILEFNVESEAELKLLAARAELKRKARFALRVNPDVRGNPSLYFHRPAGAQVRHRYPPRRSHLQERRESLD